jgi:hypothetical protein
MAKRSLSARFSLPPLVGGMTLSTPSLEGTLIRQCRNMEFGDYLVFVDESGDHGLESIDYHYPIVVLCFFVIKKAFI